MVDLVKVRMVLICGLMSSLWLRFNGHTEEAMTDIWRFVAPKINSWCQPVKIGKTVFESSD